MIQTRLVIPEQDEAFLHELYRSTREEEMAHWGWNEADKLTFMQMQFRMQQHSYHARFPVLLHQIIVHDQWAVGRIMTANASEAMQLVDISLLPAFRGKGIGTQLIGKLQDEASGSNMPVRLHVQCENPAMRLYERLGFVVTGSTEMYHAMEWRSSKTPTQK
ncbi:GNAT family N-acetyltransferase [Brevibacillus sp. 179-C9.3 HS]|uniref:GNAT family N-acetyltransferase n=1 Tax=unclassified Brevibacillus TaxID=2684853 RepID=UPI0039A2D90C